MKEGFTFPAASPEAPKDIAPKPEEIEGVLEALEKQRDSRDIPPRTDGFAIRDVLDDLGL